VAWTVGPIDGAASSWHPVAERITESGGRWFLSCANLTLNEHSGRPMADLWQSDAELSSSISVAPANRSTWRQLARHVC
jgi:hypothetical protein